jgi:hypothetical protein
MTIIESTEVSTDSGWFNKVIYDLQTNNGRLKNTIEKQAEKIEMLEIQVESIEKDVRRIMIEENPPVEEAPALKNTNVESKLDLTN